MRRGEWLQSLSSFSFTGRDLAEVSSHVGLHQVVMAWAIISPPRAWRPVKAPGGCKLTSTVGGQRSVKRRIAAVGKYVKLRLSFFLSFCRA